jgi:hypothetical protein
MKQGIQITRYISKFLQEVSFLQALIDRANSQTSSALKLQQFWDLAKRTRIAVWHLAFAFEENYVRFAVQLALFGRI